MLAAAQGTCVSAVPIGLGTHTAAQLTGTAPTLLCSGPATPGAFGAWYSFTAPSTMTVTLSSNVVGYPNVDTRFHVYTGGCASPACHAGDDDSGPNYTSITTFDVVGGVTYLIAWDSYWSASSFTFTLLETTVPPPPQNSVLFTSTSIPGAGGIQGVVDMNNDGLDDAVMPGSSSFKVAYQGAGAFNVTTFPTTNADNTASWSFAIGDWDSNGFRDLLYGGGSGATFMTADANGTAYTEWSPSNYIFCQRTNFVDLNNDGHLDAFSCHDVDANVGFINNGAGSLTFTQGGYGTTCGNYGSIFTDIDNDGAMDLFVAKCGCDPNDLMMLNNGSGAFNNIAVAQGLSDGHQSWSSAWGDFDNDGDMDVLIGASSSGYHKLMRNQQGSFTNITPGSGMDTWNGQSIEWTSHDFNNDGWVDIMGGGAIHYNNGDGTFSHDNTAPGNQAIGDLNGDGFLDVASGSGYYMNQGNDNNWIRINPQGTISNRDAIGARVTITSALGTQIRDIRSGDGFRYMSYIGAHFGLGSDEQVDEVSIKWPNGDVETIKNPAINTTHTVLQGTFTGIEQSRMEAFGLYPNPATDRLTFTGVEPRSRVEVMDAAGKLVLGSMLQGNSLSLPGLEPGMYTVRVMDGHGARVASFVAQ
jgi:hypothetical protein